MARRTAWRTGCAALALLLHGCAHVAVDADGTRHVTGFVRLSLPPAVPQGEAGADALRVQSLGLSIINSKVGSAVSLGYGDTTVATVRNDAAVPARALLLQRTGDPR